MGGVCTAFCELEQPSASHPGPRAAWDPQASDGLYPLYRGTVCAHAWHVHVCACGRLCVQVRVYACARMRISACVCVSARAGHAYICVRARVSVHACVCVHTCVAACARGCDDRRASTLTRVGGGFSGPPPLKGSVSFGDTGGLAWEPPDAPQMQRALLPRARCGLLAFLA